MARKRRRAPGPQALKANRRHPEALRPPDYMSTLIRPWWFQLTKNYARRIASELIHKGGLSADDAWAAAWPLAAEKATVEARVEESFLTTEELAATAPSQEYLAAEAPPGECPPPVDADEAERKLAYEEFRKWYYRRAHGDPPADLTMEPVDTVIYEIWESGKLRPPFGGKDFAFFAWDVRNAIRRALREVAKPGGESAFAGGDVARGGRAAMEALRGLMVMMGDEGLASSLSPNGSRRDVRLDEQRRAEWRKRRDKIKQAIEEVESLVGYVGTLAGNTRSNQGDAHALAVAFADALGRPWYEWTGEKNGALRPQAFLRFVSAAYQTIAPFKGEWNWERIVRTARETALTRHEFGSVRQG